MNINKYLLQDYILNASDILYLSKTKSIKELLKSISVTNIITINNKIHHNKISQIENFIFLLDQYIYLIKKHIFLDPIEIRFLIELSIDNKMNKIFIDKKYYLDNIEYFQEKFKKLFVHNFYTNQKIINKNVNNWKVINNFYDLCTLINNNKELYYHLFDKITCHNIDTKIPFWNKLQ